MCVRVVLGQPLLSSFCTAVFERDARGLLSPESLFRSNTRWGGGEGGGEAQPKLGVVDETTGKSCMTLPL